MNDHDPNEDVLSIDPASVTGLDPGFGTVTITDDGQRLAVRVAPGATGSATFSYAVTDGTTEGGLLSEPTTVHPDAVADAAQLRAGVVRRRALPRRVAGARGRARRHGDRSGAARAGSIPRAIRCCCSSVENASGVGSVAATPGGDVVYQHSDDGDGGEELVELAVTVADTQGQTAVEAARRAGVAAAASCRAVVRGHRHASTAGITVDVAPTSPARRARCRWSRCACSTTPRRRRPIVGGTTAFDFSAKTPGTFRVDFTVTDGAQRGDRHRADHPAARRCAAAAGDGAGGRVRASAAGRDARRLRRGLEPDAPRAAAERRRSRRADDGATLSVDAVGQNHLRVSGTTADGAAGRLGTVYVRGQRRHRRRRARASQGEATVYLLPPAPELAPIAVDDTVVVRAGAQIDIPVLENDIAAVGRPPTLNPASVRSSSDRRARLRVGRPAALPRARRARRVRHRVLGLHHGRAGARRHRGGAGAACIDDDAEPRPDGRDARGPRAERPVHDHRVRRLRHGSRRRRRDARPHRRPSPSAGSATISADGASIMYTSVPGDSGQVSFRYRVVDAFGETGEGTVRVGVLDGESNPSPVTFTDYVQVQAGDGNTIRVSPLSNDVDPTMGELRARPTCAPTCRRRSSTAATNPEYDALERRDRRRRRRDGRDRGGRRAGDDVVPVRRGVEVGQHRPRPHRGARWCARACPTIRSSPTPCSPPRPARTSRAASTCSPARSRGRAATSTTSSSRCGATPRACRCRARELRGALPATTRLIPFAVTGEGASGEVTTYAFLRVPGDDDLALTLRAGAASPEVDRARVGRRSTWRAWSRAAGRAHRGRRRRARLRRARARPSCAVESGTVVRYDAGAGAPWVDACQVPVRLAGAGGLDLPLGADHACSPRDPQPELRPGSITVGPGETATFDLAEHDDLAAARGLGRHRLRRPSTRAPRSR